MDELMNKIFTEQTNQVGAWFNQGNKTKREGGQERGVTMSDRGI